MTEDPPAGPPTKTTTPSLANAWLFLTELVNNVDMRERVYGKFKKLTPGDWTGFANLGAAEEYLFTGDQLKSLLPDSFYDGRRASWKTATPPTAGPPPTPEGGTEEPPPFIDLPIAPTRPRPGVPRSGIDDLSDPPPDFSDQ